MQVLEKILEEIEKKKQALEYNLQFEVGQASINEIRNRVSGLKYAEEIIRSHMDGATDTDDTEEKIREHIAECLHRIDNIRSFVGSKKYTNNDEKCIRNIEVLKTSITALEEYLSSKKKNGNNGWIPVEDGLPEETGYYLVQLSREMPNEDYSDKVVVLYDGEEKEFMCYAKFIIAWRPLPEPYKPKKDIEDSGARS